RSIGHTTPSPDKTTVRYTGCTRPRTILNRSARYDADANPRVRAVTIRRDPVMRGLSMAIRRARVWCAPMLSLLLVALPAATSSAQAVGGSFVGRVLDQSAGALPYARLEITNVATGVVTSVVTNEDGVYSAPNLQPGTYEIVAAFDGFNTQTKKGLTLTVGAEVVADFEMKVGDISESIMVSGQSATVDTVSETRWLIVTGPTILEQ